MSVKVVASEILFFKLFKSTGTVFNVSTSKSSLFVFKLFKPVGTLIH